MRRFQKCKYFIEFNRLLINFHSKSGNSDIILTLSTNVSFTKSIKDVVGNKKFVKVILKSPSEIALSEQKPFSSNIWPKHDTIPLKLVAEGISSSNTSTNFERLELFTIYPDLCQRLHNLTLKPDEFCVEEMFDADSILLVGSPVWQNFKGSDWTDKFGHIIGLVSKVWKEGDIWVGVVKKIVLSEL